MLPYQRMVTGLIEGRPVSLRWQVELIFRQIKTTLRLDKSESDKSYRVQCEIWARLTSAVLLFLWHAHASAECWRRHACEASFE